MTREADHGFDCAAHRAPELPWGRTMGLIAALCLVGGGALELGFRAWGAKPSLRNEPAAWQAEFDRMVEQGGSASVALLGSSRIQNGVDPALLSEALGGVPVYNISIADSGSLAMLEHVAEHTRYDGVVIVETWPSSLMLATYQAKEKKVRRFIEAKSQRSFIAPVQEWLDRESELHLTLLHPELNTTLLAKMRLRHGVWSFPLESYDEHRYSGLAFDRLAAYRFVRMEEGNRERQRALYPDPDAPQRVRERFFKAADRITARGGRVLAYHAPLGGEARRLEEERFPRQKYWDWVLEGGRVSALHYEDVPQLAEMVCPDGTHLNYSDVPRHTRQIASHVKPLL